MIAADGKKRKIQAADTKGLFAYHSVIPSPKAEPFKNVAGASRRRTHR